MGYYTFVPASKHFHAEQSGAAEACWAHNPEVDGSKPSSANYTLSGPVYRGSSLSWVQIPSLPFHGASHLHKYKTVLSSEFSPFLYYSPLSSELSFNTMTVLNVTQYVALAKPL